MRLKFISVIAFIIMLLAPTISTSAEESQKIKDIKLLMEITFSPEEEKEFYRIIIQLNTNLLKEYKDFTPYEAAIFEEEFFSAFYKNNSEINNKLIESYDRFFSHKEIKDMIVFYKTPTGKKIIQVSPQMIQEAFAEGVKLSMEIAPAAIDKAIKRLEKEGHFKK